MIIRFIINFFLFGILFFLIYTYFPEAFAKLYTWANEGFIWIKNLIDANFGSHTNTPPTHQ